MSLQNLSQLCETVIKEAEENMNAVHCLYNLSDDKKKIIDDMLNKLMELEHLEHVSKK